MEKTDNLDNFEQKFRRFTSTVRELCDISLSVLDSYSDNPYFQDKLANILIGMKEYIDIFEDENCISKQYATVDPEGVIEIPLEIIQKLGWKEGDLLFWEDMGNNTYKLSKDSV